MIASKPGDSVRLDGGPKGCAIISPVSENLWRLQMSNEEGGEFVFDCHFSDHSSMGRRLRDAYRVVSDSVTRPIPDWQKRFIQQAFA